MKLFEQFILAGQIDSANNWKKHKIFGFHLYWLYECDRHVVSCLLTEVHRRGLCTHWNSLDSTRLFQWYNEHCERNESCNVLRRETSFKFFFIFYNCNLHRVSLNAVINWQHFHTKQFIQFDAQRFWFSLSIWMQKIREKKLHSLQLSTRIHEHYTPTTSDQRIDITAANLSFDC